MIWGPSLAHSVYMARSNVDIDDAACAAVMRRYHLSTKQEEVNLALGRLPLGPLDLD